jgi:hypothetical protein
MRRASFFRYDMRNEDANVQRHPHICRTDQYQLIRDFRHAAAMALAFCPEMKTDILRDLTETG